MKQVDAREVEHIHRLDEKLSLARRNNWPEQLHATRQDQLFVVEDTMKDAREKVRKFREDSKLNSIPL
jgi:hypothetical protein